MKIIDQIFKPNLNPNKMRWSFGGLYVHDFDIFKFTEFMRMYFSTTPFHQVYGCPINTLWNGGRVFLDNDGVGSYQDTAYLKSKYSIYGTHINLTFNNHLLTEKDLDDPMCNYLLQEYYERGNYITVASDLLRKYIRSNFPKYKLKCSVILSCVNNKKHVDDFKRLQDEWDIVVIPPDFGRNIQFIKQLNCTQIEILVNEICVSNCAYRTTHYDWLAKCQKRIDNVNDTFDSDKCYMINFPQLLKRGNCHLTENEFNQLYDIGIRNFKLQGRQEFFHNVLLSYLYFVINFDYIPLIFPFRQYEVKTKPFDILTSLVETME